MKILKETHSQLLSRRSVEVLIEHKGAVTPSKAFVKKSLSEFLKVSEDLISVLHIYSGFGTNSAKIIANVYGSKEALEAIEVKKKKPKAKKEKKQGAPPK